MSVSDLPNDLVEEILCKLPFTSLRDIRLTCKTWNTLSKCKIFLEKYMTKAAESESRLFIMMYSQIYSVFNLDGSYHKVDKCQGKLIEHRLYCVSQIIHCDGLLLCVKGYNEGLMVCNPYRAHKRLIKPRDSYHFDDIYAMGYEEEKKKHKILRFLDCYQGGGRVSEYEIYDVESNTWRFFYMTPPGWNIESGHRGGVSIKGNTYWVTKGDRVERVLICFDFTRERFGPYLRLPFNSYPHLGEYIDLSSVREEQLVVLSQGRDMHAMEIWISKEITPERVLWNKLWLRVFEMNPFSIRRLDAFGSVLIDEEQKVVVIIGISQCGSRIIGSVVGADGCLKRVVELGQAEYIYRLPLMCYYVPSCVDIYQGIGM